MSHDKSCCSVQRTTIDPSSSPTSKFNFTQTAKKASLSNMVLIKRSTFLMGTADEDQIVTDGEGPVRPISVRSFYMDRYAVSNSQYKEFVEATNYQTDAEKYNWSFVFHLLLLENDRKYIIQTASTSPWWYAVQGANWAHPEGPSSTIADRLDHPVVHISWNDASAYCEWAGKRLPTEAEWEFAARGGLVQQRFPWGNELEPNGKHVCNVWQGDFPDLNTASDGYIGTAPVHAYSANGYGLFNMSGNVWEWCSNWFSPTYHLQDTNNNPQGPFTGQMKAMRGGSYLCHASYCNRYRVSARTSSTPDSSTGNLGFRCVIDAQ